MGSVADDIHAALAARFSPQHLRVTDDSAKHHGHAGARPGGQTHFSVVIVSTAFEGTSRVDRHRMIYEALTAQFASGLHALAITAQTPGEIAK